MTDRKPIPILDPVALAGADRYHFCLGTNDIITLTACDRDVEPNIPSKNGSLIPSFQDLSKAIGRDRVIWRYDPIYLIYYPDVGWMEFELYEYVV